MKTQDLIKAPLARTALFGLAALALCCLVSLPAYSAGPGDPAASPATSPATPPAAPAPGAGALAPGIANAAGITNAASADKFNVNKVIYEYQSFENRDPFKSLLRKKRGTGPDDDCSTCPPIEKFDLAQMKLIAVVVEGKIGYALVKPPDGKSYMIQLGTKIGIHDGVVTKINPDNVVVREKIIDYKNQIQIVDTEMRLREEAPK